MSIGDPLFIGITPGRLIPQEGSEFTTTQWGFDTGKRSWLTHPDTPQSAWPQRYDTDSFYRQMYITNVEASLDASGLILLTAGYGGTRSVTSIPTFSKERIIPGCGVSMFSLPAISGEGGTKLRIVAPVPKPKVTREYITTTQPTLEGVSQVVAAAFLPGLPTFSVSFLPDPDEPATTNYLTGWILDSRTWEDINGKVFLVREEMSYYWPLSA